MIDPSFVARTTHNLHTNCVEGEESPWEYAHLNHILHTILHDNVLQKGKKGKIWLSLFIPYL